VTFNGTGCIFPDWPVQMITNSAYSPKIAETATYDPDENGDVSLRHDYRLVLFDYPGVGNSQSSGEVTFDQIADDVDAMLEDISKRYSLSTDWVNLVGRSLGTLAASKFAFLRRGPSETHDLRRGLDRHQARRSGRWGGGRPPGRVRHQPF
jgi:pimeloyl-ACP methyl ester carboxylesterase